MRATWHILAQLAVVLLACGSPSGGGEPPPEYECPVYGPGTVGPRARVPTDPTVRERYRGQNGVFTDKCEAGYLIQYGCEMSTQQGPLGDPIVWVWASGDVESETVDCGGQCVDGACPNL